MSDLHFSIVKGVDLTDSRVAACTDIFGAHYGIWSSRAAEQNPLLKPGMYCTCIEIVYAHCASSPLQKKRHRIIKYTIIILPLQVHVLNCLLPKYERCVPAHTTLALCTLNDGSLVGHVFATQWSYGDGISRMANILLETRFLPRPLGLVSWITQLVVHSNHRRRGIATMLLPMLRNGSGSSAFGLVSSHPAACIALSAIGGEP